MRHSDEEIERAAERYQWLTEKLDPEVVQAEDLSDLGEVATAAETVREDESHLREAVRVARAHGRSWNHIAIALGVSRQAARQRFGRTEAADARLGTSR
jgi:hypothetical protein